MEEFCDSFVDFPKNESEAISNPLQSLEGEVECGETNIERIISELTGGVQDQFASNRTPSDVTPIGGGIILGDPANVDEILAADEGSIPSTSHNVSVLNVACQQVLKQMEYQLLALLKKNRKEQEIVKSYLSTNFKSSSPEGAKKLSLRCAGMPYFKDRYGFQPPPNEDVLRKLDNRKLLPVDFIKQHPMWNSTDSKRLINAIKQFDVAKPSGIDWLKISATDMQGKYSGSECKAKWMMHLRPNINKSKWSLKEMDDLKKLSAKYKYQNWDKIAAELGTERNGLQCCVQYQTHTAPTKGKWTKEEDTTLKSLVEKHKNKCCIPWKKIAWHFEDRSLKQCQERYTYHLGDIKKGNFTTGEDFVIVYLASKLKNFGEVAKFLPNRVATQVRSRYEYLVEISMPKFSKEEDELLSKLMAKYPRNWGKISENFKNRSRIQCRRRWGQLQRKIHLDIGSDTENEWGDLSPEKDTCRTEKSEIDAENVKKKIPTLSKPVREDRKYPEVYKKLLDHHKNCHKFLFGPKPRIPSNSVDLKKLTAKMAVTMRNLSVSHTSPISGFSVDSLSSNCEFDKEDLAVLNALSSNHQPSRGFELSRKIIPPNYMTLVALRTFTLGWDSIKNSWNFHTGVAEEPSEIDPNDRILFSDAKKLFKSRLKAIFAFPLILSNISSTGTRKPINKPKVRKAGKPLSKRKRKEHAKLMCAAYRNKLKTIADMFQESNGGSPLPETEVVEGTKKNRKKLKPTKSEPDSRANEAFGGRKRPLPEKSGTNEIVTPLKKRIAWDANSVGDVKVEQNK